MKFLLCILLILTTVLAISFSPFPIDNLAYSQFQQEKNPLDNIDIQNFNLTLGRPFYTEKFDIPTNPSIKNNDNLTLNDNLYSFSGNGTMNGIAVIAKGSGNIYLRNDGTNSVVGRALFVSNNGSASYSFEDIANTIDNNITQRMGTALFDTNATGNLKFLKSTVGIYQSYIDNEEKKGIFAMWHLKNVLNR